MGKSKAKTKTKQKTKPPTIAVEERISDESRFALGFVTGKFGGEWVVVRSSSSFNPFGLRMETVMVDKSKPESLPRCTVISTSTSVEYCMWEQTYHGA